MCGGGCLVRAVATVAVVLAVFPTAASANEDPFTGGPRVAHGVSPQGVPWQIRGKQAHGAVTFSFEVAPPGYSDAGYFSTFELPISDDFIFTADTGSDLSPRREGDLSGITSREVVAMNVDMSRGPELGIKPRLAPKAVRAKYPWARQLRFFNQFFRDGIYPTVATAFDQDGQVLARKRSHRGLFP